MDRTRSKGNGNGEGDDDVDNPELRPEPVWMNLVGRSTYPTVAVDDAVCQGVSTQQLWRQFSLTDLNMELSTPQR